MTAAIGILAAATAFFTGFCAGLLNKGSVFKKKKDSAASKVYSLKREDDEYKKFLDYDGR